MSVAGKYIIAALISVLPFHAVFGAEVLKHDTGRVQIEAVVSDLFAPWAIGFLPGGGLLITERDGVLIHFKDGIRHDISGLPKVFDKGQGGLLDVLVAGDFAQTRTIFLTFAEPRQAGAGTALARATLSSDATHLSDLRILTVKN